MQTVNVIGKVRFSSAKAQRVQLLTGSELLCFEPGQSLRIEKGGQLYYTIAGSVTIEASQTPCQVSSGQLFQADSPHELTNQGEVRAMVLSVRSAT